LKTTAGQDEVYEGHVGMAAICDRRMEGNKGTKDNKKRKKGERNVIRWENKTDKKG
jgi:hypothetical protein